MPYLVGYVTPQDYGATGNGVADDTAAVQAALNNGGPVFFPPGKYVCSTLLVPSYTTLIGANKGVAGSTSQVSTLYLKNGTNGHLLHIAATSSYIQINSMILEGNKANNSSGDLIHYDDSGSFLGADLTIVDCYLDGSPGAGIYMGNRQEALKMSRTVVLNSVGNGLTIVGSDAGIESCLVGVNGGDGININNNAWVTRVTNCDIWQNLNGININTGVNMVSIVGCGIDRNSRNGVVVADTCTGVEIASCLIHSNSQAADNTYANIQMNSTGNIAVYATSFGTDSLTNMPSYAIGITAGSLYESGNFVISGATRSGYINYAGGSLNTKTTVATSSATGLVNLTNFTLTTGQAASDVRTEAAAANPAFATAVSGDAAARWLMNADGTQKYGPGSTASDTVTGRAAAGVWYTSKNMLVGGTAPLGDNGVGEIQLANATTVPTTNPSGGTVLYATSGGLFTRDPNGTVSAMVADPRTSMAMPGALAETVNRYEVTTVSAPTSGTLYLQAVWLPAGTAVSKIGFCTGSTAATSPTHWWVALLDNTYKQQGHSADQLTAAIAASTWQNLSLAASYKATYTGTYYVALLVAATTPPTILQSGAGTPAAQFITGAGAPTPLMGGPSSTALTAPGTDGTTVYVAPTAAAAPFYLYCS